MDDLVLAAPTTDKIDWIRTKLNQEFDMTDLGEFKTFLGLEIVRDRTRRALHLLQAKYIQKILGENHMQACNPANTPADPHIRLERSQPDFEATLTEKRKYQSAVGSLMYAMLGTRPDIAYAVATVSQYSTNPTTTHWTAVKRIFRYLAGTQNRGLPYTIHGIGSGFTDADWGGGDDCKSSGGYAFTLNGTAICWTSKKQSTVALSSREAEYMASTQATKESLWLQALMIDLGARAHLEEVRNIYIDNQGAIALARNLEYHARTKHIDIQYHFVHEHLESKRITLTYLPTSEMTADILTKALPQPAFTKHNLGLGLIHWSVLMLQYDDSDTQWDHTYATGATHDHSECTSEGRCYLPPVPSRDSSYTVVEDARSTPEDSP